MLTEFREYIFFPTNAWYNTFNNLILTNGRRPAERRIDFGIEQRMVTTPQLSLSELAGFPELPSLLAETGWPLALLGPDQRVLAISQPLADLLGGTAEEWWGRSAHALLAPGQSGPLAALLRGPRPRAAQGAQLRHSSGTALPVELDVVPAGGGLTTLIVHPSSVSQQRDRILLEINKLTPTLLAATSQTELFERAGQAVRRLGLSLCLCLLEPDGAAARLAYTTITRNQFHAIAPQRSGPGRVRLPLDLPGFSQVFSQGQTLFMDPDWSFLEPFLGPQGLRCAEILLQASGVRGYILTPLQSDAQPRGVLALWGPALGSSDIPFVAAFANQLAACLAQIDLRNQMARQIQRLNSLAATAQAVTTLGALDEVLRVVCRQAQELLQGELAAVALPALDDPSALSMIATGRDADTLAAQRLPIGRSVVGQVLRAGQGVYLADLRDLPESRLPLVHVDSLRCLLCQPLIHHGAVLGALIVSHSTPGYFDQADLGYLAHYAEYAAIAVANAQLHSQLKQSEQRARALFVESEDSRRYLRTLMEHTRDVLATVTHDLIFRPLNQERVSALLGYAVAELDGQPIQRFIPEHLHEQLQSHWAKVLERQSHSFEISVRHANGGIIHTLVSAVRVPHYDEVFVILKDITHHKHLESQLRRNEKLALIGQLVSGVAHELNNPLGVILGLVQLQLFEELPEDSRSDLLTIEQSALRARRIVEQLRIFTRPQPAQPLPIDLHEAVNTALTRLARDLARVRAQVFLDLDEAMRFPAGTPDQIEHALLHLIGGALQALDCTPPDHPRHIHIRTWSTSTQAHLTISDTGEGAPIQGTLFDPGLMQRSNDEGLELGLAIVLTIVQQHGGQVRVEREPGRRGTIHLTLPVEPADEPANLALARGEVRVRTSGEQRVRQT